MLLPEASLYRLCSGFAPILACGVRFLLFKRRFQTVLPSCEMMVQTLIHSSRRLFFSRYYSLFFLSIFTYIYAFSISVCTPVSNFAENPSTLTYHFAMASSSTNPNPITALDDEDSLMLKTCNKLLTNSFTLTLLIQALFNPHPLEYHQILLPPMLLHCSLSDPLPPSSLILSRSQPILTKAKIWNTRNSNLFKKNYTTNNVEEFVVNYLQEYKEAQHSQQHDSQLSEVSLIPQSTHQLRPPPLFPETTALFVDAATDQPRSLTGAGFVLKRGPQTVLASNFSRIPGVVSPIFSEGQALVQSLTWCLESQFTPQVVFSDCLNLVSKVNGDWQDNSALSGLVSRIRLLFSNFPGASLQFIPRQFNMDAHNCAREALRFRDVS
ncbi:hypothetical protein G4B88_011232 [Cannabis sativa]|uniref:RNase H type-1 domain-containing protein n=1 Tax=Cannabis sativa TaxID=3483 RepID=A0A7J6GBH4_CANSA|nr:hypothetical protein G4B88_011232 [Cannabis sativa]